MQNSRRVVMTILRLVVSIGLLAFFVWYVDPRAIWESWKGISAGLLIAALALQMLGNVISAAKWQMVLRAQGHKLPLLWLLSLYMIGQFANNFLPTTVGGDAVRAAQLGARIDSYGRATASVLVERITGFWALSVMGGVTLYFARYYIQVNILVILIVLGCAVATTVALILMRYTGFMHAMLDRFPFPAKLRSGLHKMVDAFGTTSQAPGTMLGVLAMSIVFQSTWIAMHVVAGAALGMAVPFVLYSFMVPLTDILGLIPLFFNNLGAREGVFVLYLGQIGIGQASAVALSVLIFSIRLVISLIGGILLLIGGVNQARSVLAGKS